MVWRHWDRTIHETIVEFIAEYGVAPNILVASTVTHRRMDMAADRANLRGPNGETPKEGDYAPLSGFCGPGYSLEMYVDDELEDGWIAIVWDSDVPGDEETEEQATEPADVTRTADASGERRPQVRSAGPGPGQGGSALASLSINGLLNLVV